MLIRCIIIVCCLLVPRATFSQAKVGTTAAPFLGIAVGPRAIGMGGAFVASASDVTALYWNPAGVSRTGATEFMVSHTDWIFGTDFNWVGLTVALDADNTIGINITHLDYGEEEVTTIELPDGTGERWGAHDLAIGLTYARNLTDRFSIGGTVKYIQQGIWNERASGFALDVGILYLTDFRGLRLAASIANFGTDMKLDGKDLFIRHDPDPDVAGNNPAISAKLKTDSWPLPLLFRVGTAMNLVDDGVSRLTLAADALHPTDNVESLNVGLEYSFQNSVYLRAGYKSLFQQRSEEGMTFGFGLHYSVGGVEVRLDYSYQDFGLLKNMQTLALALRL